MRNLRHNSFSMILYVHMYVHTYIVVEQIYLRYKYIFTYILVHPKSTDTHSWCWHCLWFFCFSSYLKSVSERSFKNSQMTCHLESLAPSGWNNKYLNVHKSGTAGNWKTHKGLQSLRHSDRLLISIARNCLHSQVKIQIQDVLTTGAGHAKILFAPHVYYYYYYYWALTPLADPLIRMPNKYGIAAW